MNIQEKIESIRKQPEHIRMRYVLGSVFVSMLLISVLWVFSITVSFQKQSDSQSFGTQTIQNTPPQKTTQDDSGVSSQMNSTAPSLNEWIKK